MVAPLALKTAFVHPCRSRLGPGDRLLSERVGSAPALHQPQRYAEFHLPGLRLGLFFPQADQAEVFAGASSGAMSLCLEVLDLKDAIAHLTALGLPTPWPHPHR
jgi:hypothetical protein